MELLLEFVQFLIYTGLIVIISKYILVRTLRNLADHLKLKSKTVGNIAGVATSVPELLTICASSYSGLMSASIYNVLSSNIINLIQYYTAIIFNKNQKSLRNQAIKVDLFLVIFTIILPIFFIFVKTELQMRMALVLILLYLGSKKINDNAHKLYLKEEEKEIVQIQEDDRGERGNKRKIVRNAIIVILTGILLFVVGNLLGKTLEKLCLRFNIPQLIIGVILGFVTSIPELITFLESQKYHSKSNNDILGVVEATNNLLTSNMMNLYIIQSIGIIIFIIFNG